jgi:hypothetical protein
MNDFVMEVLNKGCTRTVNEQVEYVIWLTSLFDWDYIAVWTEQICSYWTYPWRMIQRYMWIYACVGCIYHDKDLFHFSNLHEMNTTPWCHTNCQFLGRFLQCIWVPVFWLHHDASLPFIRSFECILSKIPVHHSRITCNCSPHL